MARAKRLQGGGLCLPDLNFRSIRADVSLVAI